MVFPDPDSPIIPKESFFNKLKFILFKICFPVSFKFKLLTLRISNLFFSKLILFILKLLFNDIKFFVYNIFGFLKIFFVSPFSIIFPSLRKIMLSEIL